MGPGDSLALKLVLTPMLVGATAVLTRILPGWNIPAFAQRIAGADPAVGTLRGFLLGLFSFAGIATPCLGSSSASTRKNAISLALGCRLGLA